MTRRNSMSNYLILAALVGFATFAVFNIRTHHPNSSANLNPQRHRRLSQDTDFACYYPSDTVSNAGYLTAPSTTPNFAQQIQGSIRGKNYLAQFLSDNVATSYLRPLVFPSIIWILGACVTFLGFVIGFGCMCFGCEKQAFCNDYKNEPVTAHDVSRWGWLSVLTGAALVGFAIAGFVFTYFQMNAARPTICALYQIADHLQTGTSIVGTNGKSYIWAGSGAMKQKMNAIALDLQGVPNNLINTLVIDATNLNNDYASISSTLSQIWTSNQGRKLPNPDPLTSSTNTWLNTMYVDSLGPPSNYSTFTGSMQAEADQRYSFTLAAKTISQQWTLNYSQRSATIQNAMTQAGTAAGYFDSNFTSTAANLANLANKVDIGISFAYTILGGVFALNIMLVLAFSVYFFLRLFFRRATSLNKCMHLMWIALCGAAILSFFLATFITIVSSLVQDTCDLLQQSQQNPSNLNQFASYIPAGIIPYLTSCITGDGDLSKILDPTGELTNLGLFTNTLDSAMQLRLNTSNPIYPDSAAVINYTSIVNNLLTGRQSAFSPVNTQSPSDPLLATLTKLNSFADSSLNGIQKTVGQCSVSQDQWVYDLGNCSANRASITASNPSTSVGRPSCGSILQWDSVSIASRYTASQYLQCASLTSPYSQFQTVDNAIRQYFGACKSYMDGLSGIFTNVYNSLIALNNTQSTFRIDILSVLNVLAQIQPVTQPLINDVSNAAGTGLLDSINCQFLKADLNMLIDQLCNRYYPTINMVQVFMIICGFIAMAAAWAVWCLATKMSHEMLDHDDTLPHGETQAPQTTTEGNYAKVHNESVSQEPHV